VERGSKRGNAEKGRKEKERKKGREKGSLITETLFLYRLVPSADMTTQNDLGITSTAYGTRWYLTLFNYSLPFPAQLRVWDVFMLLGDISNAVHPNGSQSESAISFGADLDVLHSTSMALIDATREILLDSDFENAMKVLTSWVPVKDEEMLMRVVKVEWRARKKRGDRTPNEK
jgi:hypothetical protein